MKIEDELDLLRPGGLAPTPVRVHAGLSLSFSEAHHRAFVVLFTGNGAPSERAMKGPSAVYCDTQRSY